MSNRIRRVEVWSHSLVPAEAEVRVRVVPESLTAGTEVRGRLMGPRCAFAATVEVAYPFRSVRGVEAAAPGEPSLTVRAILPEASLWEPESPFLYHGPVELWQDGVRCDQVSVRHGLRTVQVSPRGLRLNGRLLTLEGRARDGCTEEEGLQLRRQGVNLLLASVRPGADDLWELADRLGFLILGRLSLAEDQLPALDRLGAHPCSLGWLLPPGAAVPGGLPAGSLVAAEREDQHPELPAGVSFVVARPEVAARSSLPVLVVGEGEVVPESVVRLGRLE